MATRRPSNAVAWLALPLSFTALAEFEPMFTATYGGGLRVQGDSEGIWFFRPDPEGRLVELPAWEPPSEKDDADE